jgi:hypothetical protein
MSLPQHLPEMETGEDATFPANLRWGGSEDADGISVPINFESAPTFCEATFIGDDINLNLMLEINNRWFYKKPGLKTIDLIPAFFENRLSGKTKIFLRIFAPPPNGVNDPSQGEGWEVNYYTIMQNKPEMRIRYAPATELP